MIYLITDGVNLKIGYTMNLQKRMLQYKTHSTTIELISSKEGSKLDEQFLHDKFELFKVRDEWFEYSDKIINYFNNYKPTNVSKDKESMYDSIQVYLTDMSGMMNITSKGELRVLLHFWKYSTYVNDSQIGNMVTINSRIMTEISKEMDVNVQSVRNIIVCLKKKELIIADNDCRGVYYLNPKYFFKGNSNDRLRCYSRTINYQIED